jgi:hypothetical protein
MNNCNDHHYMFLLTVRSLLHNYGTFYINYSRSQWPRGLSVGLRPSACRDRGFESYGGMDFFSLVQCLCCQVEVSATGRSLVQRSATEYDVCLSVIK